MATWTALTAAELGVDTIIKATTGQAFYDNPIAITEKAAGAPQLANSYIVQAMISSGQVGQGELKTTTGEVSAAGSARTLLTMPGGSYGFYPQTKQSGATSAGLVEMHVAFGTSSVGFPGTSYTTHIGVYGTSGDGTYFAQQRYFQASPPYDLGDGEVPLFVYAAVDSLGNVLATYVAPDPPWANNGPTDIRPKAWTNEKDKRNAQPLRWVRNVTPPIQAKLDSPDPQVRAEGYAEREALPLVPVLITPQFKNTDMPLIPHPFLRITQEGSPAEIPTTKVLLDPVSPIVEQLRTLMENGESISEILLDHINIDNVPLARATPPGVQAVALNWRLT